MSAEKVIYAAFKFQIVNVKQELAHPWDGEKLVKLWHYYDHVRRKRTELTSAALSGWCQWKMNRALAKT